MKINSGTWYFWKLYDIE